jgi:hypothetical protein
LQPYPTVNKFLICYFLQLFFCFTFDASYHTGAL